MATEVTLLLDDLNRDRTDREALDQLLPLVYSELRRLAGSFLNREYAVSIQTTELVHEAYFRLTKQRSVDWNNRGQFFAIAAQAMRRILIDAARARKSIKRGAEKVPITFFTFSMSMPLSPALERPIIKADSAISNRLVVEYASNKPMCDQYNYKKSQI